MRRGKIYFPGHSESSAKKKKRKLILLSIIIPILAVSIITAGMFFLLKYVPFAKKAIILAATIKPETFTELYFENHLLLPKEVILFKEYNFKFTIHNLENKDMLYPYEVYFDINGEKHMIDKNSISIKNDGYKTIAENFTIAIPVQRVKIVVSLIDKNQQVDFWIGEN
jgi:hypothetical protein